MSWDGQPKKCQHPRELPAVGRLLNEPWIVELQQKYGPAALTSTLKSYLERARAQLLAEGSVQLSGAQLAHELERQHQSLRSVINATGVVVHTNLGRAPLATEAIDAIRDVASGYSNLEYDLGQGQRGSRHDHGRRLICELTGAEDAAIVNNNAAAVLLALAALAAGREVVVSRGELVEIGGGFRIPDVMRQSGARLVEVGCTNRTHARDYVDAIGEHTALLLKVHRSNFDLLGFVAEVGEAELASIASLHQVALMVDAGSGCLTPLAQLPGERSVAQLIKDGADLVTFSGDKLLGGPQAGVVCGRADLVARVRTHSLMRALRPDKLCLAALEATLRLWRERAQDIPVQRMIRADSERLRQRAERLRALVREALPDLDGEVRACVDRVGGGASPRTELAGWALCLRLPEVEALRGRLRQGTPALIVRVEDGRLWLHLRSLSPDEDPVVAQRLIAALQGPG